MAVCRCHGRVAEVRQAPLPSRCQAAPRHWRPLSTITMRLRPRPGLDGRLAIRDQSGIVSYYLADDLGSIAETANSTGTVTLSRECDVWKKLVLGASTGSDAVRGREWDPEARLYYNRADLVELATTDLPLKTGQRLRQHMGLSRAKDMFAGKATTAGRGAFTLSFRERRRLHGRACRAQQRDQSEVCGLVVVSPRNRLSLHFLRNQSGEPGRYELSLAEVRAAVRLERRRNKHPLGTFHSHPISAAVPSKGDLSNAFLNGYELIYDVCGRHVRLWRLLKRGGRVAVREVTMVEEPRRGGARRPRSPRGGAVGRPRP